MDKIRGLLAPDGVAFISTTKSSDSCEGYSTKTNFMNSGKRFRRHYTKASLEGLLNEAHLHILGYTEDDDQEVIGKVWMNFTLQAAK